jgi:hypothetical protein
MKHKSFGRRLAQSVLRFLQGIVLLPQALAGALKNRRRKIARDAAEAERLDRIRNPSAYLGKS